MAKEKSNLTDIFNKYRYDMSIAKKSRTWFNQQVLLLSKKNITPNKLLTTYQENTVTSIVPGKMYMYFYDPKTKDSLPYYDKFPLVFPFSKTPDGFIGLNMHYLPYNLRLVLMDRLLQFKNNDKFDETTKLRYSWKLINGVSKFALASPCVKRYLSSHIRSQLLNVSSEDWATALMLPVERFAKASSLKVWAESTKMSKG